MSVASLRGICLSRSVFQRSASANPRSTNGRAPRPDSIAAVTEEERPTWGTQFSALDAAIYAAVAATPTPAFDRALGALSRAADHSRLWFGAATLLAAGGGPRGRRAAATGVASLAVTSAIVNLGLKPLGRRRRPDRAIAGVPLARHVAMPLSTSFPSGHAASAFAFASGVGAALPLAGLPLRALAALVAYSRVHTGVHYPADVVVGSVLGGAVAPLVNGLLPWRE
jgi:membrane-associated phospholipid phosphatase